MQNVAASSLAPTACRRLTFEYDDRGRRIGKKVFLWSGNDYSITPTSIAKFLYDGWNLVAELDGNNQQIRTYLWGNDLSGSLEGGTGVGGLLKVAAYTWVGNTPTVTHLFPAYDGNGNVAGLIDGSNGTLAATYEYGPFGELIRANGPMAAKNPIRFSSKYRDDESELAYFGHRFYSPSLGRWINRDPSGEDSDNSLYSFVGNHPSNAIDPTGLYEIDFHYYVIEYLFWARGYPISNSEYIAYYSQAIDDNPNTEPVGLGFSGLVSDSASTLSSIFHWPGATKSAPTQTMEASALSAVVYSLGLWSNNNEGDERLTSANLHTFADTFSHDGFTPYYSRSINSLSQHPEFGHYNHAVIRIGHGAFGSRPDYPFLRPQRAIDAARVIFDLIPARCDGIPWSTVEGDLTIYFRNTGNEFERAQTGIGMVYRRFKSASRYWGIHHFGSKNDQ